MDLIDQAGYDLVNSHPGGATDLAPRVNMVAGTLSNKANPSCDHQFTVREVLAIQNARNVTTMIDAEAAALGGVFIKLGDFSKTSDVELLDLYAHYHAEIGETAAAMRDGLKSKDLSRRAFNKIKREAFEDARAMFELLSRFESLVADDDD